MKFWLGSLPANQLQAFRKIPVLPKVHFMPGSNPMERRKQGVKYDGLSNSKTPLRNFREND